MEPASQRFTVHSNVLIHRSEFFRAARRSVWLKDSTAPVDLQDKDPEVFSMYLKCIYFGKDVLETDLQIKKKEEQSEDKSEQPGPDSFGLPNTSLTEDEDALSDDVVDKHIETLVKLYILADKLGDPTTTNIVMDELVRFCDTHQRNPIRRVVELAYASTTHGNPLRKFLRDSYLHEYNSSEYLYFNDVSFPVDFYRDIYVEFLRLKDHNAANSIGSVYKCDVGDPSKTGFGRCFYHQHNDAHPLCKPIREIRGLILRLPKDQQRLFERSGTLAQ
jgi:hypothetical protein